MKRGQKGFTLIELLVVVAILGVLAVIVIPNVAGFIGKGKVEAANTEAHNTQTAVIAYMANYNLSTWSGSVSPSSGTGTPGQFLINAGGLQATYTFTSGEITGVSLINNSKWNGLSWNPSTRTWYLP